MGRPGLLMGKEAGASQRGGSCGTAPTNSAVPLPCKPRGLYILYPIPSSILRPPLPPLRRRSDHLVGPPTSGSEPTIPHHKLWFGGLYVCLISHFVQRNILFKSVF